MCREEELKERKHAYDLAGGREYTTSSRKRSHAGTGRESRDGGRQRRHEAEREEKTERK